MKIPTSTETLKKHMGLEIYIRSQNGEYTSDGQLKRLIDKTYNANPYEYGLNKERTGPSNIEIIQGSRRSGLTYIRKKQNGEKFSSGTLRYMSEVEGLKFITDNTTGEHYYYIDGVLQMAQLRKQNDPEYSPTFTIKNVNRSENIHTTLQYELSALGVMSGYKIFVPNADRNKQVKDGQTINEDFNENLVDRFIGMNSRSDDIDCLWLDNDSNVISAFEVENSTGVDTGMSRMSSLNNTVSCFIVGTKDTYLSKFNELIETSYKDSIMKFTYLNDKVVSREYNSINEHSDAYDYEEVRTRLLKKFK
jgi:hypothetical protein